MNVTTPTPTSPTRQEAAAAMRIVAEGLASCIRVPNPSEHTKIIHANAAQQNPTFANECRSTVVKPCETDTPIPTSDFPTTNSPTSEIPTSTRRQVGNSDANG